MSGFHWLKGAEVLSILLIELAKAGILRRQKYVAVWHMRAGELKPNELGVHKHCMTTRLYVYAGKEPMLPNEKELRGQEWKPSKQKGGMQMVSPKRNKSASCSVNWKEASQMGKVSPLHHWSQWDLGYLPSQRSSC